MCGQRSDRLLPQSGAHIANTYFVPLVALVNLTVQLVGLVTPSVVTAVVPFDGNVSEMASPPTSDRPPPPTAWEPAGHVAVS